MNDQTLFRTGIAVSILVALCCATPILVILLAALGLSALGGWFGYVLIPTLVILLSITVYALLRRNRSATCSVHTAGEKHA